MGKWETVQFADVLEIINGRNQKQVENPNGKYPIYGSGGIMGYSDDYLCDAETVVIGRKGTISRPIFVSEPFWNVDTAFGLSARQSVLFPKYLYYFCKQFDFEALNTTVTIPSLTKANLLKIQIPLPPLPIQQKIADALDKASALIEMRKAQIEKLDLLIKSQFIELFKHGNYPIVMASDVCGFITKGTTPQINEISSIAEEDSIPYLKVYNLSFDGRLLFHEKPQYISRYIHEDKLKRSVVYPNDVLMNIVGPPLGKFALVEGEYPEWNINQAIAIFRAEEKILPQFLLYALMQREVLEPFLEKAVGIRQLNISLEQCRNIKFPLPPLKLQHKFVAYVEKINQLKTANKESLEKLDSNYNSLVLKCFNGEMF